MASENLIRSIQILDRLISKLEEVEPDEIREQSSAEIEGIRTSIENSANRLANYNNQPKGVFDFHFDDGPYNALYETPVYEFQETIRKNKERALAKYRVLREDLQSDLQDATEFPQVEKISRSNTTSKNIFVVHGHDEAAKQEVARFLEKLSLTPIILHERPNKGRTIIEKFEQESADANFAVVLLTPDDAYTQDGKDAFRARQNVLLELGYFVGKLGRTNVCALKKGNIELPSDYDGVLWTAMESDWKTELGKELQSAGYSIDWNRIMS